MLRSSARVTSRAWMTTSSRTFSAEASAGQIPKAVDTAGRYATALYNAANKMKSIDAVTTDVVRLQNMQSTIPTLDAFMHNPTLPRSAKVDVISDLIKKASFSPAFSHFLMVMAENGRTEEMAKTLKSFQEIVSSLKGEVVCKVTTTQPLTEWELALLKKKVKERFFADRPETDITIETALDDDLLGGMTIQVGDRFMDLSTRTELRKLQEAIGQSIS